MPISFDCYSARNQWALGMMHIAVWSSLRCAQAALVSYDVTTSEKNRTRLRTVADNAITFVEGKAKEYSLSPEIIEALEQIKSIFARVMHPLQPDLINIIGDYVDDFDTLQALKHISPAKSLPNIEQIPAITKRLQKVNGHFNALTPEEQQTLKQVGRYIHELHIGHYFYQKDHPDAPDFDADIPSCTDSVQLQETLKYVPNLISLKVLSGTITALPEELPKNLEEIDLSGCKQLTDEGVQSLSQCRRLKKCALTDTGLTRLPPLSLTLEEIHVGGCRHLLKQETLDALATFPCLKIINLYNDDTHNIWHLDHLPQFSQSLERIDFPEAQCSQEAVDTLARYPNLKSVNLLDAPRLPPMSHTLEELWFYSFRSGGSDEEYMQSIASLSQYPKLRKLNLTRSEAPSCELPQLSQTLEEIILSIDTLTPQGLAALSAYPNLHTIVLQNHGDAPPLEGEEVAPLANVKNLRKLVLYNAIDIPQFSSTLEELHIAVFDDEVTPLPRYAISSLSQYPYLKKMRLEKQNLKKFPVLSQCLEEISLFWCTVTDAGIATLARYPRLRAVDLQETNCTRLPQFPVTIEEIGIMGVHLSRQEIAKVGRYPNLKKLKIDSSQLPLLPPLPDTLEELDVYTDHDPAVAAEYTRALPAFRQRYPSVIIFESEEFF